MQVIVDLCMKIEKSFEEKIQFQEHFMHFNCYKVKLLLFSSFQIHFYLRICFCLQHRLLVFIYVLFLFRIHYICHING